MTGSYAKRWVFTLNNYTEEDEVNLKNLFDNGSVDYLVYGREVGQNGTPHLQGFISFSERKRFNAARQSLGLRCHIELCRGTPQQAATYCRKDGDFVEFGELDSLAGERGKRTDWHGFKEWIEAFGSVPTDRDIASEWPHLFGRYPSSCRTFASLFGNKTTLVQGELREWQRELDEYINSPPDDRRIRFVIDKAGNRGKSWLVRYWFSHRDDSQRLSVGKRDDLAYAIDPTKRVFIFDVPRGGMEFLQYNILEQLKDQMVFSPKYESVSKVLAHKVHVVVFCNEDPDITKMTMDRYDLMILDEPEIYN